MKYLIVILLLAMLAGVEFLHELEHGDAHGLALCVTAQARQDAIKDILLHHAHSHR